MHAIRSLPLMTIRLGPDPNRTYLQRHNEMFPQLYGQLGAQQKRGRVGRIAEAADVDVAGDLDVRGSLYAFAVAAGAIVAALVLTGAAYKLMQPDSLTAGRVLGFTAVFLFGLVAGGAVAYVLRRVLAVVLISGGAAMAGWVVWRIAQAL